MTTPRKQPAGPPNNAVVRATFRLPRSAYLPVLFLVIGVTVLVSSAAWLPVYLLPLLVAVFVARRSTVVDAEQITVRAIFGTVRVPWSRVRGLLIDERNHVSVALDDQTSVELPYVRVRHLDVLSKVSGNLVPAIPAAAPAESDTAPAESDTAPATFDTARAKNVPVENVDQ